MTTTKKTGRCNVYPGVWAAIYGCEGVGTFYGWQRATTMHGSSTRKYACPGCRAAKLATERMNIPQHQDFLRQSQELASVPNYRFERVIKVNGRPVLARHGAPLASILERWPLFRPVA